MTELTAADILKLILPEQGIYFACSYGRIGSQQVPVRTIEDLVTTAVGFNQRGGQAYMALGGFANGSTRKQNNVIALRSLWLDIDCDRPDEKGGIKKGDYETQAEAYGALAQFISASGLPKPLIINSGWGLHIYFPFAHDILPDQWRIMAEALKVLVDTLGLKVDSHRSMDYASVLRVPGTWNYRGTYHKAVQLMQYCDPIQPEEFSVLLKTQYAAPTVRPSLVPMPQGSAGLNFGKVIDAFANNRNRDAELIIKSCPQMAWAGSPHSHRDTWAHMLAIMRFCRNGLEVAHRISANDSGRYNPTVLEYQYKTLGEGPPTCTTFASVKLGQAVCEGCLFKGSITSPVQLGDATEVKQDEPVKLTAPAPKPKVLVDGRIPFNGYDYVVLPGKGVFERCRDDKGNLEKYENGTPKLIKINENEFYIDEAQLDKTDVQERKFVKFYIKNKHGESKIVFFDMNNITKDATIKWLGNHSLLPVSPKFNSQMWIFMSTYIAQLQAAKSTQRIANFGWVDGNAMEGSKMQDFVVGTRIYTPKGDHEIALSNDRCARIAQEEYITCGSLEEWKKVPRLYRQLKQVEGQLFMCASFAAPFMSKISGPTKNLVLSMWDARGGKGKSTLLSAANSVWGHPERLTCSKDDTASARYQVLGVTRNLPRTMDELTTMTDKEISSLLFALANGREKRKSRQSGTDLASTGRWSTVIMITSNRSLYEMLRNISGHTAAELMRLVEMECKFNNYAGTEFGPLVTSSVLAMESNYGLAGRAFMKNCYEHPQIVDEIVKQAYAFAQKNLNVSEERFWICGLGMVLAVGKAVKDQGLIDYDLDYMESWILDYLLPKMRSQVWSGLQGTTDILVTFLNEHIDSTLTLTEPIDMDGNPVGKVIINQIPRNTLRIRIDRTDRRVYINRKYLDSWLINNRFSISAFQAGLIKQKIFDPVDGIGYVALGQGTVYNTGVNVCYKLDVQNLSDLPGDDTIT